MFSSLSLSDEATDNASKEFIFLPIVVDTLALAAAVSPFKIATLIPAEETGLATAPSSSELSVSIELLLFPRGDNSIFAADDVVDDELDEPDWLEAGAVLGLWPTLS